MLNSHFEDPHSDINGNDKNLYHQSIVYTMDFLTNSCPTNNKIKNDESFRFKSSKVLYITDSILNLLALHEKVTDSAIVLTSTNSLDQHVFYYIKNY